MHQITANDREYARKLVVSRISLEPNVPPWGPQWAHVAAEEALDEAARLYVPCEDCFLRFARPFIERHVEEALARQRAMPIDAPGIWYDEPHEVDFLEYEEDE